MDQGICSASRESTQRAIKEADVAQLDDWEVVTSCSPGAHKLRTGDEGNTSNPEVGGSTHLRVTKSAEMVNLYIRT
jgi:hypothetical protein